MQKTASTGFMEIIAKRAAPGILIFNLQDKLVYMNPEAHTIFSSSTRPTYSNQNGYHFIPQEVYQICTRLKRRLKTTNNGRTDSSVSAITVRHSPPMVYALRGMFFQDHEKAENHNAKFFMVIIEKFSHARGMDLARAKEVFHLSSREIEVAKLVLRGCSNKDMAEKLFVSEYTIKDHLKHIMKKMGVATRAKIMSKIFQS
jgi:DNA-binding CsgD family transcriptional regulator